MWTFNNEVSWTNEYFIKNEVEKRKICGEKIQRPGNPVQMLIHHICKISLEDHFSCCLQTSPEIFQIHTSFYKIEWQNTTASWYLIDLHICEKQFTIKKRYDENIWYKLSAKTLIQWYLFLQFKNITLRSRINVSSAVIRTRPSPLINFSNLKSCSKKNWNV